jgi:hypothetical protein
MHHERALHAQVREHPADGLDQVPVVHAHDLRLRRGGIGERAQQVEDRPDAYLLARPQRVLHGRVEDRGEHEPEPDALDLPLHVSGTFSGNSGTSSDVTTIVNVFEWLLSET